MSVISITPQNDPSRTDLSLSDSNPSSDFWMGRTVQNAYFGLTSAEATRLTLRILAICAVSTGVGIVSFATGPATLLAIPCFLGAIGAIWYSTNQDDYENREDLERYRRDAMGMGLDAVAQAHGWTNLLQWGIFTPDVFVQKYRSHLHGKNLVAIINYYEKVSALIAQVHHLRFQYQLPPPREWSGQWRQETATMTFDQIIQTYSLEKLEKYHILEIGELQRLQALKRDLEEIKKSYDKDIAVVERDFEIFTADFKRIYDIACVEADQAYNSNPALRDLRDLELRFVRDRETIQTRLSRRKSEAKAHFVDSVAPLTKNGAISQQRLTSSEKTTFNLHNSDFNREEAHAELEARTQFMEMNIRCQMDRERLNADVSTARSERDRKKNEAKAIFDADVASMKKSKIELLRPIEAAFQSSISDINHRYRSYLRTLGVQTSR